MRSMTCTGSAWLEMSQSEGSPITPILEPLSFCLARATVSSAPILPLRYSGVPWSTSPLRPCWFRYDRISSDAARELLFPEVRR